MKKGVVFRIFFVVLFLFSFIGFVVFCDVPFVKAAGEPVYNSIESCRDLGVNDGGSSEQTRKYYSISKEIVMNRPDCLVISGSYITIKFLRGGKITGITGNRHVAILISRTNNAPVPEVVIEGDGSDDVNIQNTDMGISVQPSYLAPVKISGVNIVGCGVGIEVAGTTMNYYDGDTITLEKNKISGFTTSGSGTAKGISITAACNLQIEGNAIDSSEGYGIYIEDLSSDRLNTKLFTRNVIKNQIKNVRVGVYLKNAVDVNVGAEGAKNIITSTKDWGVSMAGQCKRNKILSNIITNENFEEKQLGGGIDTAGEDNSIKSNEITLKTSGSAARYSYGMTVYGKNNVFFDNKLVFNPEEDKVSVWAVIFRTSESTKFYHNKIVGAYRGVGVGVVETSRDRQDKLTGVTVIRDNYLKTISKYDLGIEEYIYRSQGRDANLLLNPAERFGAVTEKNPEHNSVLGSVFSSGNYYGGLNGYSESDGCNSDAKYGFCGSPCLLSTDSNRDEIYPLGACSKSNENVCNKGLNTLKNDKGYCDYFPLAKEKVVADCRVLFPSCAINDNEGFKINIPASSIPDSYSGIDLSSFKDVISACNLYEGGCVLQAPSDNSCPDFAWAFADESENPVGAISTDIPPVGSSEVPVRLTVLTNEISGYILDVEFTATDCSGGTGEMSVWLHDVINGRLTKVDLLGNPVVAYGPGMEIDATPLQVIASAASGDAGGPGFSDPTSLLNIQSFPPTV